ncbi:MAG: rhomboid family intramembrane serine protease [Sphingomonas sp.]|uniref:rhomboid family intramembrane serine protease n=1 Tax=Sphingomonas sp. TaxID=28214 RepID=UPI00120C1449|nr:rhomboid family intramembrane serine protease [Sphingomonas sp.]THD35134.1 MAG: rhomboid family intramembrane serine protease [Sphingomonas sp.]
MNGIDLPRGRVTDALVAFIFVTAMLQLVVVIAMTAARYGFMPFDVVAGAWRQDPVRTLFSPLVSQFLMASIFATLLNTIFLLIAGRYVERSVGPVGLIATFVAGAYGGALARLALTPHSILVTQSASAGLYALVGAYLTLYGVPTILPVPRHYGRLAQIAALAGFWMLITVAFMLASGVFELSLGVIDPLGGLIAGLLVARPLLRWRYRKA